MTALLLVRHGQASWGAEDYDQLSPLGEEQARVLGAALAARGVRPDLLVSGSLKRQQQTARGLVTGAGWPSEVVVDAGWDEFDHRSTTTGVLEFDEVSGESDKERVRRFEATVDSWAGGEDHHDYLEGFAAFTDRVEEALARTLARLGPRETGVVVTSAGPISHVTAALLDAGLPTWRRLTRVMANASLTTVIAGGSGRSLVTFNDHSHLEAVDPGLRTYR